MTYPTSAAIYLTTLTCSVCNSGFYLTSGSNTCNARTYIDTACTSFDPYSDNCLVCGNGYYLDVSTTKCVANPSGIYQCNKYTDASTCIRCSAPYYL